MRIVPSIERLRQRATAQALEARFGRAAIVAALRAEANALRDALAAGPSAARSSSRPATPEDAAAWIEARLPARLARTFTPTLRRIINATGVLLHTNLGRAPLAAAVVRQLAEVSGYVSIEYDLEAGTRGARDVHAEALLCRLTGADAAVVVNNNAAAVLLVLTALAAGREVIISRGELVEIGGGFRVPDVLRASGAILREVGTTNRTRVADYGAAISERTALLLRVHPSNFRIEGFTERPALTEIAALGKRFGLPVVEDLGSGHLLPLPGVLDSEPVVTDSVAAGADLSTFSGDKLLGGPQAGIIVGRRDLVDCIRRHPLMRALRVDKLTYAALEATLCEYACDRASATVPVQRMLRLTGAEIEARARRVLERVHAASGESALSLTIVDGDSTIGGGSAPGELLPTRLLAVHAPDVGASELARRLRAADPPLVARIVENRLVLDLRTVTPEDDELVASLLAAALR
ncbi:MAG: L-seryl-tRNA(Sec) selenium transferase [Luteitalea sp.]|nr:L-seryl-tRNA(Sec) selenium transferase [Luteitalea sp.]